MSERASDTASRAVSVFVLSAQTLSPLNDLQPGKKHICRLPILIHNNLLIHLNALLAHQNRPGRFLRPNEELFRDALERGSSEAGITT